jgi:hypothetical protein
MCIPARNKLVVSVFQSMNHPLGEASLRCQLASSVSQTRWTSIEVILASLASLKTIRHNPRGMGKRFYGREGRHRLWELSG